MKRPDVLGQLAVAPKEYADLPSIPAGLMYLMGCRSFNQFCSTLRGLAKPEEYCPFCSTERARRNVQPSETTRKWMLLKNEFPHRNTTQMWLIVPFRHLTDISRLNPGDKTEIFDLFSRCIANNEIVGGGVMWRFGHPRLNVGTIEHAHVNVIVPTPGQEYRPPFAKNASEHAEDYQRMLGFRDELMTRGGVAWLGSVQGILETQPAV